MKRVLYVGDLNRYSRSYQRFLAMQELGYEVAGISFVPGSYLPGVSPGPGLWYRLRYKLGYPVDETGVNRFIPAKAQSFKPDLLWVDKGLMIRPATLEAVKKEHPQVKTVLWMEEFIVPRCNRSVYSMACLPHYDFVFTPKSQNYHSKWVSQKGIKKLFLVDDTYDPNTHFPISVSESEREEFGSDVGFIGTFEQDRAEKILFLARSGLGVRVWGNGWQAWVGRHPGLRVENRPLYGLDYSKAICSTKINLCFLRKHNRDRQTNRTMEIPACGAFMLAERTGEHLRLFEEGKEAVYFDANNAGELLEKARYYLAHPDERQAIAGAGRERCLKSGYSHHERLKWIMEKVRDAL